MTACKQTASIGAAATDSRSGAKSDGAEERKPSRKGKKAKGMLAVKSNGAEKPKTHDLSDVTRGLAVMSIAEELSEDEDLSLFALYCYRNELWMTNFKGVYDKPSVDAIRKKATENWKLLNDSEKAPYVAKARVTRILIAKVHENQKTRMLASVMANKMMNLKM
uniref:Uncharacterized protein n=1 Tax=Avena sativa TaxID=4498 RepID=A0ACD5YJW6_AVESA